MEEGLMKMLSNILITKYSRGIKEIQPYYISPIEIGLLWAKITYPKCAEMFFIK